MGFGGFQHVRVAVGEHGQLVVLVEASEGLGDFGKSTQTLDGSHESADFFVRMGDAGAVHDLADGEVANLAIGRVVALQQSVDHRVFEVGAAPPGNEGVGIAWPVLGLEERGGEFAQASLHVDDGAVLVEHAEFDG
jgi:hypothetical protein